MKTRSIRYVSVMLAVLMILSFSAFASSENEIAEAKRYLQNYRMVRTNSQGKTYTLSFDFQSENDLNETAVYLVSIGRDAFNAEVVAALSNENTGNTHGNVQPCTAEPSVVYETISGNGSHRVTATAHGYSSFDTLGEAEYVVELSYYVVVRDGVMKNIDTPRINVTLYTSSCSWGNASLPSYCTDYSCGVTANYTITKTLEIPVGPTGIPVKAETDPDSFALLTTLER